MAGVDDRAFPGRLGLRARPDQEARDRLDRLLGRRRPTARQVAAAELRQALERQRQVGAALVRRDGVDLVDDHRARGPEHAAAGLGAEQDVERLRRGHDDMRRAAAHALALGRWRVAGAHQGADLHVRQALSPQSLADPGERRFEVALDVVRERLQRRDVDDLGLVGSWPSSPWRTSASIAARKAASVLPDPVGAAISVCRPAWIAGHASACAGVGAAKLRSNQAATAG